MCTLTAYMHELWFISIEMSALTVHLNFAAVPQTQSLRLWFDAVYFYIAAEQCRMVSPVFGVCVTIDSLN